MGILIPFFVIFFCCLIIWRACDGFEIGSEYIGRNMSEGVRGGTINAISSSLPELLTTLIALFYLRNEDGFSVGLGTTAGSALFNGMIIPAVCILAVVGSVVLGTKVTSVNVSTRVLLRDGLTLIFCEIVLILMINGNTLYWWQGLVLMLLYFAYFGYMIFGTRRVESSAPGVDDDEDDEEEGTPGMWGQFFYWMSLGPLLDLESMFVKEHHREQIRKEEWNGWPIMLTSAAVIGIACWALVWACEALGSGPGNELHQSYSFLGQELSGIGMQTMFVAVIFASMATSVPDTVMSIRDARDGDYDDAVANALGSNIFDICFALGFPLFLYTLLFGELHMEPDIAMLSSELRFLLLILTVVGFFVYLIGKRTTNEDGAVCVQMGRGKAVILIALYSVFAFYVVSRGQDAQWAIDVSEVIDGWLQGLPGKESAD
ncbi:MAG: sodium:calcium antiporter [Planctomycetota bacterium]